MNLLDFIYTLQWREPMLLWACLLPLAILALRILCQRDRLDSYVDKELHYWVVVETKMAITKYIFSRTSVFVLAWLLVVIAAAGPRQAQDIPGEDVTIARDIYLVVDLSRSMHATDIEPDRIRRAKIELYDLVSHAESDKNRFGIIVYTAGAHILSPLTYDASLVAHYISMLDKLSLPTFGSNPVSALELAINTLNDIGNPASILWVTDGDIEQQYTRELQQLTTRANELGITLYILNSGTIEGDAIQLDDGEWLYDDDQAVVSRSQVEVIKEFADRTGGAVSSIADDNSHWQRLYFNGIKSHGNKSQASVPAENKIWREYFPYFLFPGIVLFFIALIPYPLPSRLPGVTANSMALVLFLLFLPNKDVFADSDLQRAYNRFANNQFTAALQHYELVAGYNGRFGQGASAYRLGDYSMAINQFTQAVLLAESDKQRANALYNLANSYFRIGDYPDAIQLYTDVLQYDPEMQAARQNLALSIELQSAVELKLQQQKAKAEKLGRGPKSRNAEENIEIPDFGAVSIDDSEKQTDSERTVSELYETLLEKGVEYADLAAKDTQEIEQHSRSQLFADAQRNMQALQNKEELLWKRLFEIDSDFAAPQDRPNHVSGVKPW